MKFVVGDIHGECTKLELLIGNIIQYDTSAEFIFIGDYLDKGENPWSTLEYLVWLSTRSMCTFLRGNHEYYWEMMKDDHDQYANYLRKYGAINTINSVGSDLNIIHARDTMLATFRQFFTGLTNYVELEKFVIVHSGISPEDYDRRLETIGVEKLLFNRYAFLAHPQRYFGKRVIFGHTGFFTPFYDSFKIGIDTAACFLPDQPLTAFCLEQEMLINSFNEKRKLGQIDPNCCPVIPRVRPWRQKIY